jgi:NitT/TauT family transport system substrate-binding protein
MMHQHIDLLTPEAVADAVATSQLDAVPAIAARGELEFFYTQLMVRNAALVGGKLPDSGFYTAPAST